MKFIIVFFLVLFSVSTQATIPWRARVVCDGPTGQAVYDDFVFTYYGQPVFQHQFVIKSPGINEYFYRLGGVIPEIARNYPQEVIINLYRDYTDHSEVPAKLSNTIGPFTYVVKMNLPEVKVMFVSRETGNVLGDWIFRECRQVRSGF